MYQQHYNHPQIYKNPPEDYTKYLGQKIGLLLMFIVTLVINGLTGAGIIGKSQKYISDKYMTLVTPPDYAFTIWAVIYTFWTLFMLLQFVPNKYLSQPQMFYALSFKGKQLFLH